MQQNGNNGQQAQQDRPQRQFSWRSFIFQLVLMYLMYNYFFGAKQNTSDPTTGKALPPHSPLWRGGESMQLRVFVCEHEEMDSEAFNTGLVWAEDDIFFDWRPENERIKDTVITPSQVSSWKLPSSLPPPSLLTTPPHRGEGCAEQRNLVGAHIPDQGRPLSRPRFSALQKVCTPLPSSQYALLDDLPFC